MMPSVWRLLILFVCLSVSTPAWATTYYMATAAGGGSNANPGTIGSPWLTWAYAKTQMVSGDHLYIRNGTYNESIALDTALAALSGTTWANATVIEAYPTETVTVNGIGGCGTAGTTTRYIIFKGTARNFKLPGGVGLSTCGSSTAIGDHFRFDGIYIDQNHALYDSCFYLGGGGPLSYGDYSEVLNSYIGECAVPGSAGYPPPYNGAYMHGIYVSASNVLVADTEFYDITGYCIQNYDPVMLPSNNVYERNILRGCGTDNALNSSFAMILHSGTGNIARNNLIYDNVNGIQANSGSGSTIVNNTVYNNGQASPSVPCTTNCYAAIFSTASGNIVRNNIVYGNNINSITNSGSGAVTSNNLTADPSFTDVSGSNRDLTLQVSSAAKDAGVTLAAVTTDYVGLARPQGTSYDIGAYERAVGVPDPPPFVGNPLFAVIASVSVQSAAGGAITTAAIDTTGADLIVPAVVDYADGGTTNLTDSKSNTWNARTAYTEASGARVRLYDCVQPCTVGTGHTFTGTPATTPSHPGLAVIAFSGSLNPTFDQINGATVASATSRTTGSVTPSQDHEVLVSALAFDHTTATIDSGFTRVQMLGASAVVYGLGIAWKRQTTLAAVNPTWTINAAGPIAATIASYKFAEQPVIQYRLR